MARQTRKRKNCVCGAPLVRGNCTNKNAKKCKRIREGLKQQE